jgi:hypothetical protein
MNPLPNQSGATFGPTLGVSRNLNWDIGPQGQLVAAQPLAQGGGDLNGSANVAHLMYQAGTNATRWQMPRKFCNSGNWCGIV